MVNANQVFIIIGIVALAILALLVIFMRKQKPQKQPSQLAMLGMTLVVLGIIFGSAFSDNRLIPYSFFGAGILLSVIDIIQQRKAK